MKHFPVRKAGVRSCCDTFSSMYSSRKCCMNRFVNRCQDIPTVFIRAGDEECTDTHRARIAAFHGSDYFCASVGIYTRMCRGWRSDKPCERKGPRRENICSAHVLLPLGRYVTYRHDHILMGRSVARADVILEGNVFLTVTQPTSVSYTKADLVTLSATKYSLTLFC